MRRMSSLLEVWMKELIDLPECRKKMQKSGSESRECTARGAMGTHPGPLRCECTPHRHGVRVISSAQMTTRQVCSMPTREEHERRCEGLSPPIPLCEGLGSGLV